MGIFSRNKKGKLGSAAHIKPSTVGSSNEISLSVLDAAKHKMDERHGEAKRDEELGKIKLFSGNHEVGYDVVGESEDKAKRSIVPETPLVSSDTIDNRDKLNVPLAAHELLIDEESFEQKVASRKAKRNKSKSAKVVVAIIVFVALLTAIAIGIGVFKYFQTDYYTLERQTIEQISLTDDTIISVNEILADPSEENNRAKIDTILSVIPKAQQVLDGTDNMLMGLQNKAITASEKEIASQLALSADGRKKILSSGEELLKKIQDAQKHLQLIDSSWDNIDKADNSAREAATFVSNPTEANLTAASARLDEAISFIDTASALLKQEQDAQPKLNFSTYASYLETLRTVYSEQKLAISSIFASDTTAARQHQDASEVAEKKANSLAGTLGYAGQPILDAYEESSKSTIEEYEIARSQVAAADEYLRKYWDSSSNSV